MIGRVLAASPASIHSSLPLRQCLEYAFLSLRVSYQVCAKSQREAHAALSALSLHGAVPYSYSRESVQSTSDCRIQIAPPPLAPEMATSASVRSAYLTVLKFPRAPPLVPRALSLLARPAQARLPRLTPLAARLLQSAMGRVRSAGCPALPQSAIGCVRSAGCPAL